MKMSFHLKTNNKSLPKIIIFAVVFLIFIFGMNAIFPSIWSSLSLNVARPIFLFREMFSGAVHNVLGSGDAPYIEELKDRVASLESENLYLKARVGELEGKVEFASSFDLKEDPIVSKIISRPPRTPYDIFIVDRGTSHGVQNGMKAFYGPGVYMGVVEEVSRHSARIKAISSSNSIFDVVIGKKLETIMEGRGGGNFIAKVPKGVSLNIGDNVRFADSGYIVGQISEIESNPQETFETVLVAVPVNIYETRWVSIK